MSEERDLKDIFFEETNELIVQFEQDILSLEENSEDKELVNRIFRTAHTIKGSAAFVGFMGISSFSHKLENLLDLVRKGELLVDSKLVNVLLNGLDAIKKMIADPENEDLLNDADVVKVIEQIAEYVPEAEGSKPKVEQKPLYFRVRLQFHEDIFETGTDPLLLIEELEEKGEIVDYNINMSDLPDIYKIDPYTLYISWNIAVKGNKGVTQKDVEDIFVFVKDDGKIEVEEISERDLKMEEKKIGEILVEKGLVKEQDIEQALGKQTKLGEILTKEGKVTPNQLEKVVQQQEDARKVKESTSIRVDTHKLDKLMNLVGELVINQARVAQIASKKEKLDILELSSTAETLDRITREIQEQIMKARMIPIENTFNQFQRMVRDLAIEKKKDIKLKIIGKETELDKTLIELINDPLKHMIRNSVDHGIETIEERVSSGKSPDGTITLNAFHEAGNIVIEVSDDGKGLDKERILKKAREKELVAYDKELSEDEIYKLIFLPGFSTAEEVSEISGRGVGMDVVKNNINKLRGNIEIYTRPGEGTTFKIILPLTLAIIDGMLVKIGGDLFVVPLLSIVESIRPKSTEIKHVNVESEVVNVRGEYIPLIRLYELFGIKTEYTDPSKALTVIVSMGKNKVCLLVDDIIGQQQAVIKSLEENYKSIKGISGATILGDGTVAMILDIAAIIKLAATEESHMKNM